ncbi:MAG: hypothetical protein J7513_00205 [Solirubrobacteraceae bacterium]|nr:hypothetical protein [Solirubrobacteraceae bacterium]
MKAVRMGSALYGAGGPDTLIGSETADRLYGGRADNSIAAGGGDDYVEGGTGSDRIDAGEGNNTIFGGSGQDQVTAGNGNNYVDVGGGNDTAVLGNGNNVLVTSSGGGSFRLGNGNNVVYYGSGIVHISAGTGVNQFWLSAVGAVRSLDCGGNPDSVVHVNRDSVIGLSLERLINERSTGCARFELFDGAPRYVADIAGLWESFRLVGGAGRDKLYGGHGGGTIAGGEGDNELWADQYEDTGLPRSRDYTTTITAGNGNNRVFGGRGTNIIIVGNGDNFVRGGNHRNRIVVGGGENHIYLRGSHSRNRVVISGHDANRRGSYVESLANGRRPRIWCRDGAVAAIVYGNTKPKSDCATVVPIRSKKGKRLQLEFALGTPAADPVVNGQLEPGQFGIGVPRPGPAG